MKQYENRLRQIREEYHESKTRLAVMLKIKRMTYAKYEEGLSQIPVDQAIALARHFNVSLDYLFGISQINNGFPGNCDHPTVQPDEQQKERSSFPQSLEE
ncbi:MAG: helix-turn-helix transcriptional regulator [Lachnospiraceae bacterium]|nr:helix-turn-helix transcriptional regulator [Lachnospiraceae bacterium]